MVQLSLSTNLSWRLLPRVEAVQYIDVRRKIRTGPYRNPPTNAHVLTSACRLHEDAKYADQYEVYGYRHELCSCVTTFLPHRDAHWSHHRLRGFPVPIDRTNVSGTLDALHSAAMYNDCFQRVLSTHLETRRSVVAYHPPLWVAETGTSAFYVFCAESVLYTKRYISQQYADGPYQELNYSNVR